MSGLNFESVSKKRHHTRDMSLLGVRLSRAVFPAPKLSLPCHDNRKFSEKLP